MKKRVEHLRRKALKIALTALRLVSREQVEMLERLGIEVKKVRP